VHHININPSTGCRKSTRSCLRFRAVYRGSPGSASHPCPSGVFFPAQLPSQSINLSTHPLTHHTQLHAQPINFPSHPQDRRRTSRVSSAAANPRRLSAHGRISGRHPQIYSLDVPFPGALPIPILAHEPININILSFLSPTLPLSRLRKPPSPCPPPDHEIAFKVKASVMICL
jgi:hypothetical protein